MYFAKVFPFALTLLIAVFIGFSTLTPPSETAPSFSVPDKLAHTIAFLALILPLGWSRPVNLKWLVPAAIVYGAAIEMLQPNVGRSAEWADFVADAFGVTLGLGICWMKGRVRG